MKAFFSVLAAGILSIPLSGQIPVLNSYPSAAATIYLDFDGEYVSGTGWNWYGPIDAQPAGVSDAAILEIFNRVAEDYRVFNINVTTDSGVYAAAPVFRRTRVIITPSYQWYGAAGGVAYVGSFLWGDDTPAWVFSNLLGYNTKNIAEAISHEGGHTLGLQHQSRYDSACNKTAEYSGGQGSGEIGWAPIMGIGYYKNITTWTSGTNSYGCNYIQNDIDVIAQVVGLRTDDHGNVPVSATPVTMTGTNFEASGIINNDPDVDAFTFTVPTAAHFRLVAVPENVGSGNAGANVDIKVALLNQFADTIGQYNPSDLLDAGIDTNLLAGTYYFVVDGVGNVNLLNYGSVGFYLLNGSIDQALPVTRFTLGAAHTGTSDQLYWSYVSDETIKYQAVERSNNGSQFEEIARLSSLARTYSCTSREADTYYRVRAVTANNQVYYSNVAALRSKTNAITNGNVVSSYIDVNAPSNCAFQLCDESGRLLQRGRLNAGRNRILFNFSPRGILILKLTGAGATYAQKLIRQ